MGILAKFEKQPADVQDYDVSFVDWLAGMGTTGSSVVVTAEDGITQPTAAVLLNGVVKVWLSGGAHGVSYKITVTLTTAGSPARVKEVEFVVKVKET